MILRVILFCSLASLSGCNPPREQITIGAPAAKALKTTDLAQDGKNRLDLLAQQTGFAKNAVFTNYQRRTKSQWYNGWPRRIDFTGVSWSQKQAGTVITPRHLLLAAHYPIKIGTTVSFHDRAGAIHNRKIIKTISFRNATAEVRSDVAISLLDEPLPPSIKIYRLLPPREDYPHTLPGAPVLVTDQTRRVFIHQINRITNHGISFRKNPDFPEMLYKNLVVGDSGNPSFLLVGGEPVLIEAHTGGGPGSGPFYSSPPLFKAIQNAVARLDPSYRIQTVPLDPALAPAPPKVEKPKPKPPVARVRRVPAQPATGTGTPLAPQKRQPRVRRVPTPQENKKSP